jgi:thymidylate kinase
MFIAFLGCDGSGKSSVIQGLTSALEVEGHTITLGHWRPIPFTKSSASASATAEDPHGQRPRGLAGSMLKLAWLWINWWAAWFQHLRSARNKGFVLFDRYHGDLIVDPKRYRYGGPMWLAKLATRFMPQPDLVIFLDADPDILLARKQEVAKSALERARVNYLKFCSDSTFCRIIVASQPLDAVIAETMTAITGGNQIPLNP